MFLQDVEGGDADAAAADAAAASTATATPRAAVTQKQLQKLLRRFRDQPVIYVPDVAIADLAPRLAARAADICPLMQEPISPSPPEDGGR